MLDAQFIHVTSCGVPIVVMDVKRFSVTSSLRIVTDRNGRLQAIE